MAVGEREREREREREKKKRIDPPTGRVARSSTSRSYSQIIGLQQQVSLVAAQCQHKYMKKDNEREREREAAAAAAASRLHYLFFILS